ncbi:RNA-binding KH domain-containing protein PEPPER-like [Silene latifolia]|uniref:RNA-binding KH domain-containing protein PEPPER-like n=1 Tax=Silene latifolia TaxID=37657 RepID=UPI003D76E097
MTDAAQAEKTEATTNTVASKWAGWPGDNVFRLIVPVVKVGCIIGRKGELIKKLCDDTRAKVRVLDAPLSTPDRVVLISGKEELDASLSPAMDAVIRLFKRVTDLDGDDKGLGPDAAAFCSIRLLVASTQATNLIGRQGATVKTIQEGSGAVVRILPEGELPSYATPDERIVEIHGEAFKVHKALELVLGHLRKFLHDHSMVDVFEKTYNARISQDRTADVWADKTQNVSLNTLSQTLTGDDLCPSFKSDYFNRDVDLETKLTRSTLSQYGSDLGHSSLYARELVRAAAPIITQVTQTMQIPLSYAEDIIGVAGTNIARIRSSSGAVLTIQESHGQGHEIIVEIKGTATQVQTAQQLIQESINGHRSLTGANIYGEPERRLSSTYSELSDTPYPSYASQSLGGGYSSFGGGYSSYRF